MNLDFMESTMKCLIYWQKKIWISLMTKTVTLRFLVLANPGMTMNQWLDLFMLIGQATTRLGPTPGWISTTPDRGRTGGSRGRWRLRIRRKLWSFKRSKEKKEESCLMELKKLVGLI